MNPTPPPFAPTREEVVAELAEIAARVGARRYLIEWGRGMPDEGELRRVQEAMHGADERKDAKAA